jgi:iron complex outermembrane receptor protein
MVLKRNMLSMALASATLLLTGNVQAQSAEEDKTREAASKEEAESLDKVTVKGIRRGIENAIETKRDNTSIVESISAEDIGKLPDSSIAESIARLPGLTAQRVRGRAQQISIRGFAGDFSGVTLNGREQVSTGDNRSAEFDQYPSELLSGVIVYKTPDASLIGQGLSGTVDLQTIRPLSYGESVVAVNYRYEQVETNGIKQGGNRYSFSYIDQFLDNTIGMTIGYSHQDSPNQALEFGTWGYSGQNLNGANITQASAENVRDGLMATLEFKPNDQFSSIIDMFYTNYEREFNKNNVQFAAGAVASSSPGQTEWSNLNLIMLKMEYQPEENDLFSFAWNNKYKFNDNWSVSADLSLSTATRQWDIIEAWGSFPGRAAFAGQYGGGSAIVNPKGYWDFTFEDDVSNPNDLALVDAGNWGDQNGYRKDFTIDDKIKAFRVDATRSFEEGYFSSLEFGVNVTNRTKSREALEGKLCLNDASQPQCAQINGVNVEAPWPGVATSFNFAGFGDVAVFDPNDAPLNWRLNNNGDIGRKNWEVEETVNTFYLQANIDTDIGEYPLKGNIGAQYVQVDQESSGVLAIQGVVQGDVFTTGISYSDFLPSLNLSLGLPAEQYIRFATAKQLMRPRMDAMNASAQIGYDPTNQRWQGSGGNPYLKPWEATAFDIAYEKYFTTENGSKGYVSAAYFYKDLSTWILEETVLYDFTGYPLPGNLPPADPTQDVLTRNINGSGGTMEGLELAASVPFGMLWSPLEGFGLVASYSDTTSEILRNGVLQPIPGLSKYVSNISLYYERYGFSVRVNQRSRSGFLAEERIFDGNLSPVYFNGEDVVDAQMNYSFQSGALENLTLFLQFNNLTDEASTRSNSDGLPEGYYEYGKSALAGFSYKF